MKLWALIQGTLVANIVEQETQPTLFGQWIEITGTRVVPGWEYIDGQFVDPNPPPPVPAIITKLAFRFRMTDAEYVGVLSAAKTDVEVTAWVETFNMVTQINLQDARTISGVETLVSKNLLTQARADEILTAPVQPGERP